MNLSKSYKHTTQKTPYLYSTIPERLEFHARRNPDKTAFVIVSPSQERTIIDCKTLHEKSLQFAKGLIKSGIEPGDVVGVSLPNSLEWLICTFGIQASGAVPLYFGFNRFDGKDIVETLKSIKNCKAVVFNPGQQDVHWKIFEKIAQMENEKGKVKSDQVPSLCLVICDKLPSTSCHPFTVEDIISQAKEIEVPLTKNDPDDICAIFLTSGSTGVPKAVPRTHVSVLMMGYDNSNSLGMNEDDIYYSDSLFIWGGGFPHTFLFKGTTRITVSSLFGFTSIAERSLFGVTCIENERCTVATFFPYCLMEIGLKCPPCKQWPLKAVSSTGLPISNICAEVGCKIAKKFVNLYGTTELGYIAEKPVHHSSQYSSFKIGKPFPGNEIKIVDDNGFIVPINTSGEICVRHYGRFLGYINNEEKTKQVLSVNGWYKTDDLGIMDENEEITLVGRKSDVMIIAGAIIHPSYLEEKIMKHPDVEEACVVPISDEKLFQQQCACVVPKLGKHLDKQSIVSYMKDGIGSSESEYGVGIPRYFIFLDSLPRTPVGKVFRKGVIALAEKKLNI